MPSQNRLFTPRAHLMVKRGGLYTSDYSPFPKRITEEGHRRVTEKGNYRVSERETPIDP